jgi:hypothetical protein
MGPVILTSHHLKIFVIYIYIVWSDKYEKKYIIFEVLTAVVMKSCIYWDITPCSPLKVNRRYGGIFRLHLQGWRISQAWKLMARRGLAFNELHGVMSQKTELFIIKKTYMIWWNLWVYFYNMKISVGRYYIFTNSMRTSLLFRNRLFLLHYISGILHLTTSKLKTLSPPQIKHARSYKQRKKASFWRRSQSQNETVTRSFLLRVTPIVFFLDYFTTCWVCTAFKFGWLIFHTIERRIIRRKWSGKDLEGSDRGLAEVLSNICLVKWGESWKISTGLADISEEMRKKYFPNTNLQCYR